MFSRCGLSSTDVLRFRRDVRIGLAPVTKMPALQVAEVAPLVAESDEVIMVEFLLWLDMKRNNVMHFKKVKPAA